MRKFVSIILLYGVICLHAAEKPVYTLVQVPFFSPQTDPVKTLQQMNADITCYNSREGLVEAVVTGEQINLLKKAGYPVMTEIKNMQKHVESLTNEGYFKHFHSYEQIISEIRQLVDAFPDIIALHDIGDTYEKEFGQGGFDIYAVKISDNVERDETEAEILYTGAIHAREIITPEIILYFIHYLVNGYGHDPYVTHLVNNREMWLVPVVNPDGFSFVFTGDYRAVTTDLDYRDPIWWRKNKRDNNLNVVFEIRYDGVDLNRNFGYKWGYDNSGSSPDWGDATYRGTGAFSEPEAQVIRDLANQRDFIISLFYHSYSQLWLYPFGYARVNPPEPDYTAFRALADSCTAYNGYRPGNFANGAIYQVNGDTDDWLYGEKGIFAFTPEVGSIEQGRFWPDTSMIVPQIMENLGPNLYMAWAAGEEPIVQHTRLPDVDQPEPFYTLYAAINKPIRLTTDVSLDESTFKVFYSRNKTGPFTAEPLLPGTGPNNYRAEIPGGGWDGTIYYYVSASDVQGRVGSSPRGAPMAVDSFQVAMDDQPPVIEHTPVAFLSPTETPVFTALITDNHGVDSTWLEIRIAGGESGTFTGKGDGNLFTFEVDPDGLVLSPGDSVEYRIGAQDVSSARNVQVRPANGWYFAGVYRSLVLYDFEKDAVCTTGDQSDWEWGTPQTGPQTAFSGSHVWATNLDGDYNNFADGFLYLPPLVLDSELAGAAFFWKHWYATEKNGNIKDGGNVKISIDGGPFQVVEPEKEYDGLIGAQNTFLGHQPGFGGNGQTWQSARINLADYAGHSIQLAFHFGSDGSGTAAGWYLDDMQYLVFPGIFTGVDGSGQPVPDDWSLSPNYPNPFNAGTRLTVHVPASGFVEIAVFNTLGQIISRLKQGHVGPGTYTLHWDGRDLSGKNVPSGIYWARMTTQNRTITQKMLYMR